MPCVPVNVSTDVICQGTGLSVFWQESAGADFYTAMLEDSYGHLTNCQSMDNTTCTVNHLACGQTYHVSVIASDRYCDSLPSAVIDVDTGKKKQKSSEYGFTQTNTSQMLLKVSDPFQKDMLILMVPWQNEKLCRLVTFL